MISPPIINKGSNVTLSDAPGAPVNFTLTVRGETMTGTVCGFTCGAVRLKKSKM
jgi:hypothetical protein